MTRFTKAFFSKQGKIGSTLADQKLTPEQRREFGRRGAAKRWGKKKKKKVKGGAE